MKNDKGQLLVPVSIDEKTMTMYVHIDNTALVAATTKELALPVLFDFDDTGKLIGVEIDFPGPPGGEK